MTANLDKFLCKCTWLFEQRGALKTGFTAYMLNLLKTPVNICIEGQVRSIGQPSDEAIDSCFVRMTNWLQLVRMTVKAEMPSFESLQLFRVFDLDADAGERDLKRLANMLQLDPARLQAEFEDLRPSAQWHFRNGSPSVQASWVTAFQKAKPGTTHGA